MTTDVTVDRIEGDFAVLEIAGADEMVDWPLAALPPGVREGDRLQFTVAVCGGGPTLDEAKARLERLRAAAPDDDGEIDL